MLRSTGMRFCVVLAGALLLSPAPILAKNLQPDPVPDAWLSAHGDRANTGFANVATAPAQRASRTEALGTIAPGAGPVIGPDGTVYIGNTQGKLMAFKRDGTPAWSRQLAAGQSILASPVVSSDGSIFVISVSSSTDSSVDPPYTRPDSTLHKFYAGGGYAWQVPFPEHGTKAPVSDGHGFTSAAPNIWRFNGEEAVIVPVSYPNRVAVGREVWLTAFSVDAPAVLSEKLVTYFGQSTTGRSDLCDSKMFCLIPIPGFRGHGEAVPHDPKNDIPAGAKAPMAGAAIFTFAGGGTPWIVVTDNVYDIAGYTFSTQTGFFEGFRAHDETLQLAGPPMVLPDSTAFVAGGGDVVTFRGQAIKQRLRAGGLSVSAPTRMADGKVIFTRMDGWQRWQNNAAGPHTILRGESMVSAAASQTHLFMSRANALYSFDNTMNVAAKFEWLGGGVSPPAIGPYGDVYAIAANTLHVFPYHCPECPGVVPPLSAPETQADTAPLTTTGTVAPVEQQPEQQAATGPQGDTPATPVQSHYDNPQGPHGLRLYACTEIGGNTCGKKVANAFCQAQGWGKVDRFDTDSKKTQAETMSGATCTKNKCKVFDFIDCEN